ncbi:MAG: MarR family transcriptional regulator [Armatimonadetes bacterium]|nr:MarR family transcriptional regulator [Armatimonadota bacterium]
MIAVEQEMTSRDCNEYTEMVAEVFVDTIRKSAIKSACPDPDGEITQALMECLQYVYLHGASPIRQIAAGLEISLSAASQLVDRLVKKNMVTRSQSKSDRRLTQVELTEAGQTAVREMRQRKTEWFDSILEAMSPSHRRALRDSLESFLALALETRDDADRACVRCGMGNVQSCIINKLKNKYNTTQQVSREESGR